MAQLSVFVPDLFAQLFAETGGAIDAARWPALALLLRRADERPLDTTPLEHTLMTLCGVRAEDVSQMPVAALTTVIDQNKGAEIDIMRADPVHLRADPNQILLFDDPSIMPSATEADALIEALNAGLSDVRLSRGRHPARWYIHSAHALDTTTHSPRRANGHSIAEFLPRGAGAHALAQLTNDAQMILHDTAVNLAREARGVSPINSIWCWGGGHAHDVAVSAPDFVVGDDVLTAALARRFNFEWCAELEPDEVIARLKQQNHRGVVVIGAPTGGIDTIAPTADIDAFEQRWCRVLLRALRRFRLQSLRLVTDRHAYWLTPRSLFKVWRRPFVMTENGA